MKRPRLGVLGAVLARVVAPLALGAALYLLLREDDIALFRWVEALGGGPLLGAMRGATHGLAAFVPRFVLGSFPDGAWAFAFGAAMALVWRAERGTLSARVWLALGFVVAVGIEAGQGLGVVPGVFDPLDLLAIALGYAAPTLGSFRTTLPSCASSSPPPS